MSNLTEEQKVGLKKLREPFPAHHISKMCRSTKKDNPKGKCPKCGGWHGLPAIQLDYVGHAALTDRLLDVDLGWVWKPMAINTNGYPAIDDDGGMWIELTVCGITRYGYGDAQGKTGGDAMKERIGDALRNAGMRFGMALELWHKGTLHLPEDDDIQEQNAEDVEKVTLDWIAKIQECVDVATLTTVGDEIKQSAIDGAPLIKIRAAYAVQLNALKNKKAANESVTEQAA